MPYARPSQAEGESPQTYSVPTVPFPVLADTRTRKVPWSTRTRPLHTSLPYLMVLPIFLHNILLALPPPLS